MTPHSRLLHRFRRMLTPPGRPSEALGVPASGDDLAGELRPLLAVLDDVAREAAAIRARAQQHARERRAQGAREVADILERAHAEAERVRVRAAAAAREQAAARCAAERDAAARELERLRSVREERIEELVAEVVRCVRRAGR